MDTVLQDIQRSLGRIEGKVDNLVTTSTDHGKRLWSLERWQSKLIGMAAVLSAGVTYFFGVKV